MRVIIINLVLIFFATIGKHYIPVNKKAREETKKTIRKQLTEHLKK
jgi:hypothetical protein